MTNVGASCVQSDLRVCACADSWACVGDARARSVDKQECKFSHVSGTLLARFRRMKWPMIFDARFLTSLEKLRSC